MLEGGDVVSRGSVACAFDALSCLLVAAAAVFMFVLLLLLLLLVCECAALNV